MTTGFLFFKLLLLMVDVLVLKALAVDGSGSEAILVVLENRERGRHHFNRGQVEGEG